MSGGLSPSELAPGLLLGEGVEIGAGVQIGGHVVIHDGARIGAGSRIGDHAQIRDRAEVGEGVTIGSLTSVDPEVTIGPRSSVQTGSYLTRGTVLEEDVFVGPGVILTNDDTMGRHPAGQALRGALLRRACRIGGRVVICPGIEIGEEAFVAAGAAVTRDVAPRAVVVGVPARTLREVPDRDLIDNWR